MHITPSQPTDNQSSLTESPTSSQVSPRNADTTTSDSTISTQAQKSTDTDTALKHFHNSPFYRTIIDNNLFRPLGMERAEPTPRYRLICTMTSIDEDTSAEALIEDTTGGNSTQRVSIGEKIGNATVVDIQPKQVVLDEKGNRQHSASKNIYGCPPNSGRSTP